MVPEPAHRLPRLRGFAEPQPLMRLRDGEVGPQRRFAEGIACGERGAEFGTYRHGDASRPQGADEGAIIIALFRGEAADPRLLQVLGSGTILRRLFGLLNAIRQRGCREQSAIADGVDEQQGVVKVHAAVDQPVASRPRHQVEIRLVRGGPARWARERTMHRFRRGHHVEDQVGLPFDMRPEIAVEILIGDRARPPLREPITTGPGRRPRCRSRRRNRPRRTCGRHPEPGRCVPERASAVSDVGPVAEPRQRIVHRIAGPGLALDVDIERLAICALRQSLNRSSGVLTRIRGMARASASAGLTP